MQYFSLLRICYLFNLLIIYRKDFIESVGTNDAVPILEQSLSNYTTLSKNQILPIRYCNRDYMLKVVELPPSYNSVRITGCSFQV